MYRMDTSTLAMMSYLWRRGNGTVSSQMPSEIAEQVTLVVGTPDFLWQLQTTISDDLGKSMKAIAKDVQVAVPTGRLRVLDDSRYHSYAMKRRRFMSNITLLNYLLQSKQLPSKLENSEEHGKLFILFYFFQIKIYLNRTKDVTGIMSGRFLQTLMRFMWCCTLNSSSVMLLTILSNAGDVMLL